MYHLNTLMIQNVHVNFQAMNSKIVTRARYSKSKNLAYILQIASKIKFILQYICHVQDRKWLSDI